MNFIKRFFIWTAIILLGIIIFGLFFAGEEKDIQISEQEIKDWPFISKSGTFKCLNESAYFVTNNKYYALTGKGMKSFKKPKNQDVISINEQRLPNEKLLLLLRKGGADTESEEFKSTFRGGYPLTPIPEEIQVMVRTCQNDN